MWVLPLISKIEAEKCVLLLLVRPRERARGKGFLLGLMLQEVKTE
jgi:hypothetical protein